MDLFPNLKWEQFFSYYQQFKTGKEQVQREVVVPESIYLITQGRQLVR